jgi:DNA repair protein SbcC/Rad50
MILKKIILNNIRSYKHQEITFPKGSVLLSGDIGSGKTSVLLGIEFALFGLQPGQRGSFLLRNGENEGKVILELEIDNKNIIIERALKKNKTITQNFCAISIDGEKKEISVTELKNLILTLLDYPLEFSKKQNILYKFTVYTPQEEMKQIILQDPEIRINTLRHVFGIDKYRTVIDNVSIINSKIREEKRINQALISNIVNDKELLLIKEKELKDKQEEIILFEEKLFSKKGKRKKIEEQLLEISKKIEEKNKFKSEIEKTQIMILTKKDYFSSNLKMINQIEIQIKEIEKLRFDFLKIEDLIKKIEEKKENKEDYNKKIIDISSNINSLESKNIENKKIIDKLTYLEVCPTCLQDVNENYKSKIINQLNSNTKVNLDKIELLRSEKNSILSDISDLNLTISSYEKELSDLRILKIKIESIKEKKKYLENLRENNYKLDEDIDFLNKHIDELKSSILKMNKFDNIFEETNKEFKEISNQEKNFEIKIAELKKEIEFFIKQIKVLDEQIKKSQEIELKINYLSLLENWLLKKFTPLIYFIEKNVMIKLKQEFSKFFNEWFCILVSDSFNTFLKDDFTPIIEQFDYEIDYAYLSGGERTAVALAYRLALNQVINSILSKIKTKDLIILDEPTDGFSESQLDKMRDILIQLNIGQMIIVSHEPKIEDFVENVIKLKKEGGNSKVENLNN